jgi:predicted TIM-barrel fold metal-dependent hydrolase
MRIDAYTHFFPAKYFQRLTDSKVPDIGKRVREVPAIHDVDVRRKVIDSFPDYRQIICVALPPIGTWTPAEKAEEVARIANDGLKELCDKYPDQFAGFVAEVPLTAPDAGARESERAIKDLGACGVQIVTNVNGKALDQPEFEPFFAKMNALKKPVWVHPTRTAKTPDYPTEEKSLYEIWWTFGWSYDTAAFMARMVFSKTLDKFPDLKIIVHHFGGIVPMLEGRIGPGWDQLGARTSDEDYVSLRKSMKKRPLDYFKQDFYADTAVFTSDAATELGMKFYPLEKIVFASDCPFDPEKGTMYIRETLRIIDALDLTREQRDQVYYGNLERITGKTFVK